MNYQTCLIGAALFFIFGAMAFVGLFAVVMVGQGLANQGETIATVIGQESAAPETTTGDLTTSLVGFNKNKVMEDSDFINISTMTVTQIQQFLTSQKSILSSYSEFGRSAAQIISDAAQRYGVNPQVILVVLHKEQSLLNSNTADQERRLRKAMGAACFDDGTCDPRLFGFGRQVEAGTAILRRWFDRSRAGKADPFRVGATTTIDGQTVTPENHATVSLYKYTPHITPDKTNFYRFFRNFFLRSSE